MTFDVLGIGNAIVDGVATTSGAFLDEKGHAKAGMRLGDDATAARLTAAIGTGVDSSADSLSPFDARPRTSLAPLASRRGIALAPP